MDAISFFSPLSADPRSVDDGHSCANGKAAASVMQYRYVVFVRVGE